jgi:methionyl-tRNA synthetase
VVQRDEDGKVGLGDWDISRDAPYFGIEIPDAPGKYFYVWLDAPIGYLASLKNLFAKRALDAVDAYLADPEVEQIHFIGKDIVYFHTLFWPAMLQFSGRKVPDRVYVHGFLTVSGEKMSKSRGTGISPLRYLELGMNPEWLRYYIAAKLNARVEDVDFNPDDFVARVNSRPGGQVHQHRQPRRRLPGQALSAAGCRRRGRGRPRAAGRPARHADTVRTQLYEEREFGKALREVMLLADRVNEYVDAAQALGTGQAAGHGRRAARRVQRLHRGLPLLTCTSSRCCRHWPRKVEPSCRSRRWPGPMRRAPGRAHDRRPTST